MSDDPPRARDRKPPPNLRLGLRDKPEVKALLAELSKDLKPGEDPLFYELPDSADDPEACAPDEARVYVGPTAPPMAHHKTLEMDRVKVAPAVDPRRAVTQRMPAKQPGASPWVAPEVPVDKAALPSAMGPEAGREDAPPMSRPASAGPKSAAGRKRTALAGALALGVVAAIGIAAAARGPKATGKTSASAAAPSVGATAIPSAAASPSTGASVAPAATPSMTATASATASQPIKLPAGRPRGAFEDPYADAAVAPSPAVTVAPVAPAPQPSMAPAVTATVAPKAPPPATSSEKPIYD